MKRATIKEVAREAGVSIATVSRVINNNYYVSPIIEAKVRKAVVDTGYVPNSIARSLKSNTTFLIGFILSDISNMTLMTIAREIENVIREKGYNLLVCSTENDEKMERKYIESLISRKISGIILHSTGTLDDYIARISQEIPIALVYRHVDHRAFVGDTVDSHSVQSIYNLTQHLIALGHRRIAIINGFMQFSTSRDRWKGFLSAMQEAGIPVVDEYICNGDFTEPSGVSGAAYLMSRNPAPTAIIGMNHMVSTGALKYLAAAGIRVPEDISLVCYGEIDNVELMRIQPTRVHQNPSVLGEKAGELILDRIMTPSRSNREFIFGAELIEGNSVAGPKE